MDVFDSSHILIFYTSSIIVGKEAHLTEEQQQLCDITGDGVIDTMDVLEIAEYCMYLYLTDDPVDFEVFIADPIYREMLSEQFWKPAAWYRVELNSTIAQDIIAVALKAFRTS